MNVNMNYFKRISFILSILFAILSAAEEIEWELLVLDNSLVDQLFSIPTFKLKSDCGIENIDPVSYFFFLLNSEVDQSLIACFLYFPIPAI